MAKPQRGIEWDDDRQQWRVSVAVGPRGAVRRRRKRFPAAATRDEMERWQRRTRVALEDDLAAAPAPQAKAESPLTLAAAATAYLATVRSMPSYESRTHDLQAWVRALGPRSVATLTAADLAEVWDGWRKEGRAANTLNHRRTALLECMRLTAPERVPVVERGVRWLTAPREAPRALPYSLIEDLLAAMPESATQAWLRVRAYTGFAPATIARLTPADVDLARATVRVSTRQKGGQVAGVVLPLIPQAVEAFRLVTRLRAWKRRPSRQATAVSFQRAVQRVSARYVADGGTPLPPMRPYDLRHSFATLVLEATNGDLQQTMELMQHRDLATTLTYTRARVSTSLQEAARKVGAAVPPARRAVLPFSASVAPTRCPQEEIVPKNTQVTGLPKPVRRVRFP